MYGNISAIELSSRLHFLENHTKYQAAELEKKQQKIDEQAEEIKALKEELNRITEFLKLAGKKIYGSSTERMSEDYGQLCLFEEDEEEQTERIAETNVNSHTRKKRCTLEEKLKNIPKTVIIHELSEEEKTCPKCGSEMTVIGYDSFIQVEYIPAHIEVQEHRKKKLFAAAAAGTAKKACLLLQMPLHPLSSEAMQLRRSFHILSAKNMSRLFRYTVSKRNFCIRESVCHVRQWSTS